MPVFCLPVRVYLEDTDAQGVVYNASYFRFMERARTDYLRERDIDHHALEESLGLAVVLTSIEARFIAPGRLGDMLSVSAEVTGIKGARAQFVQQICRGSREGELLAEGRAEVACIEKSSGRATRWPAIVLKGLSR